MGNRYGQSSELWNIDCSPELPYDVLMTSFDNVDGHDNHNNAWNFPVFYYAGK
jgi:hypothetical protein